MIIYKTTNLLNKKFYIGKDSKNDPVYLGSGMLLNKAIKKYGKENFIKEIIETCDDACSLNKRECYWINELGSTNRDIGYNISFGGDGGDTFTNHPELDNIKRKISEGQIGREAWNKGKVGVYSEEHLENLSNIRKEKYSGENHPRFVDIPSTELEDLLRTKTLYEVADMYGVCTETVRSRVSENDLNLKELRGGKKLGKKSNYYEISDKLFADILTTREDDKMSIEELANHFGLGVNKIRKEFRIRNIKIKRIR